MNTSKFAVYAALAGVLSAPACAARNFEAYTRGDRLFDQNGVRCTVKTTRHGEQIQVTQQEDVPFLTRGWYNKKTGKIDVFEYSGIYGTKEQKDVKAASLLRKCTPNPNQ